MKTPFYIYATYFALLAFCVYYACVGIEGHDPFKIIFGSVGTIILALAIRTIAKGYKKGFDDDDELDNCGCMVSFAALFILLSTIAVFVCAVVYFSHIFISSYVF